MEIFLEISKNLGSIKYVIGFSILALVILLWLQLSGLLPIFREFVKKKALNGHYKPPAEMVNQSQQMIRREENLEEKHDDIKKAITDSTLLLAKEMGQMEVRLTEKIGEKVGEANQKAIRAQARADEAYQYTDNMTKEFKNRFEKLEPRHS